MIRVFIYEDSDVRKESLKTLLDFTDNMLFVGSASNCSGVVQDMILCQPDVVLMDVEMPLANGIVGVKEIKLKFSYIKVIMQTVYEDIDKIFKAFQYGAEGFIIKKASKGQIIECIEKVYEGQVFITSGLAVKVMNLIQEANQLPDHTFSFSTMEWDIVELLSLGYSNKVIIEKLNIQEEKINRHIKGIYHKLQLPK